MPTKGQINGMQGVYLAAAELTRNGLVVSPTSRSTYGADLLVTDQQHTRAWSVEVKTNAGLANFWLLNKHASELKSESHVYVLVNLGQTVLHPEGGRPQFYVVPSGVVAGCVRINPSKKLPGAAFYQVNRCDVEGYKDGWKFFGVGVPATAA